MNLSGIPAKLLLRAASLPENAGARTLLERAAGLRDHSPPLAPPEAPQNASERVEAVHVTLPLPPKECHPNSRVHWSKKARAAKAYRRTAYFAAWEALGGMVGRLGPQWKAATVKIVFYAPDARRRDPDGVLASLKSCLDGLSRPHGASPGAMIVADDSGFSFLPVEMRVDRENPRVEIFVIRAS